MLKLYFALGAQLVKTRRRLELLLENLPCDQDPSEYYETSSQLLEPLIICYDSLVFILNFLIVITRVPFS